MLRVFRGRIIDNHFHFRISDLKNRQTGRFDHAISVPELDATGRQLVLLSAGTIETGCMPLSGQMKLGAISSVSGVGSGYYRPPVVCKYIARLAATAPADLDHPKPPDKFQQNAIGWSIPELRCPAS